MTNEKIKQIFDFFTDVIKESNIVFLKEEKSGNDRIPPRIQMIISFTLLDVLANYWYEYLDKTGKINGKSRNWYDIFCKTEKNKEYFKGKQWKLLSSKRLYKLRNSLVHFMGMSVFNEDIHVVLIPNDFSDEENNRLKDKVEKEYTLITIRPHDFHNLIKQGGILMLNEMEQDFKVSHIDQEKKQKFANGMEKIWNKFWKEGAVKIYKPK